MTAESLKLIITAETKGIRKELDGVKKQLGSTTTAAKSCSNVLKRLFKGFSVAAAVTALVKFGKAAVQVASDLQEVENVVNVSFGNMSEEVDSFAKNAIQNFGMSELAAKQTASTFMAMGNGMGIAAESGKDMALQLTALTGDMASFYNVEQSVAQSALNSVYTGETESLKKFGVVMSQANLQQFLYRKGIQATVSELSQAELVQLRYAYVMETLAQAQGDFARTSGSWANQTKILKEQWNQFKGIIGSGLIAALTPLVKLLNTILSYFIQIGNAIAKAFGGESITSATTNASNLGSDMSGIDSGLSDAGGGAENLADGLDDASGAAKELKRQTMGFDELNIMSDNSSSGGSGKGKGGAGSGLSGLGGGYTFDYSETTKKNETAFDKFADKLKNIFNNKIKPVINAFMRGLDIEEIKEHWIDAFDKISVAIKNMTDQFDFRRYQSAFEGLAESIGNFINTLSTTYADMAGTIVSGIITAFTAPTVTFVNETLPNLIEAVSKAADTASVLVEELGKTIQTIWTGSIQPILDLAGQVIDDIEKMFNQWWESRGSKVFKDIQDTIKSVSDTVRNIWDTIISPIVQALVEDLQGLWTNSIQPLWQSIVEFLDEVWDLIMALWNVVIKPIVDFIVNTVGPQVVNVVSFIGDVVSDVVDGITGFIQGLIDIIKGMIKFLNGVFTADWRKCWEGVKDIFAGIWESISSVVKVPINVMISAINAMLRGVASGVNACIDAINRIHVNVPDWVPGIGGKRFGFNIAHVSAYQVPKLAKGGIAIGSTLAEIGEAGKEAVLPLERNTGWMDMLAEKLSSKMEGGNGTITFIAQLDGKTLFEEVVKQNNREVMIKGSSPIKV